MGWTHYWEREPEPPEEGFARAAADCRKVMPVLGIPFGDEQGTGSPVFAEDRIASTDPAGRPASPSPFADSSRQEEIERGCFPTARRSNCLTTSAFR